MGKRIILISLVLSVVLSMCGCGMVNCNGVSYDDYDIVGIKPRYGSCESYGGQYEEKVWIVTVTFANYSDEPLSFDDAVDRYSFKVYQEGVELQAHDFQDYKQHQKVKSGSSIDIDFLFVPYKGKSLEIELTVWTGFGIEGITYRYTN